MIAGGAKIGMRVKYNMRSAHGELARHNGHEGFIVELDTYDGLHKVRFDDGYTTEIRAERLTEVVFDDFD